MDKDHGILLCKISAPYQINETRHGLSSIDWVKKECLSPCGQFNGFNPFVRRNAVPFADIIVEDFVIGHGYFKI
jgi:hypothetical protein